MADVFAAHPSMDDVRALAADVVEILDLGEWRITSLARPTDEAANMADIDVTHPFREAHINWNTYLFSDDANIKDAKPWQVCVIHEYLHARVGVYRDHLRLTAHALMDESLRAELICNLAADLEECATEQAAWAIWKLYQRTKGGDPHGTDTSADGGPH